MAGRKRKAETIDLTNEDDTPNRNKKQPRAGSSQQSHTLPTPPGSSQATSFHSDYHSGFRSTPASSAAQHSQSERDAWTSTQEAEDDIRRAVDSTQDAEDDVHEDYTLYGILNTKIVGCRFYNGRATPGEYVIIRREPRNPYDKNAIRIDNVMHQQIGHIGRNVAAKLAPLMDSTELHVEGELTGEKGFYDCPIGLKLFGTVDLNLQANLKARMKELKLPTNELDKAEKERNKRMKELEKQRKAREKAAAQMRKNGAAVIDETEGPNKYGNFNTVGIVSEDDTEALESLLSNTATYNPRDVQDVVNKFGTGEDTLAKMAMAKQPEKLKTTMLPYQLQGLQWMLEHESPRLPSKGSEDVVQLWRNSHGIYSNIATSFSVTQPPELASGGILADDMGLGKTIQVLSLIMADPKPTGQPTLIISPLSVMSNWSSQATQHVKKKYAPRVLVYHGQENRGLTPQQFQEYDIVVTTYQTMTMELFPFGKDKPGQVPAQKGLFAVEWRRIVLDEGHQIRNPKAKMSRAACSLMAKSRWVLTGTPIVNNLKDLYSHIKFIRLSGGLNEFDIFNGTLIRPLKSGRPEARVLLQALMGTLCLRRMKDMKFVDLKLPGIKFHKYPIKFLPHEKERYDAFKSEALGLVEAAKSKKGDNTITHLLEVLLRLRQTCNHWKMCGEERIQKLLALVEENEVVDIANSANRKALQDLLQLKIDSQEECPVCMDSMTNPMITSCAHAFCRDCIEKVIETQHKCPMCRAELNDVTCLVAPANDFGEGEGLADIDVDASSSKIEALVQVLKASAKEKNTKTVVFSQWTSFLDLVQAQLTKNGLHHARLDGKMSAGKRDAAIDALNNEDEVKILLASLGVCSVGLNLVAANNVILADSWWAPAIEDQAVDRVYRLGQTRECKVVRLVVEDTIEDEVLEIQAKKRKLAGMAFGEKRERREERRAGTLGDIETLLR